MKKWGIYLMVASMLAASALACGFPLPAGSGALRIAKAVCAEGEAPASCQARQDAYQLMNSLQSAAVEDLSMTLLIDAEGEQLSANLTGSYAYQVVSDDTGLGANISAHFAEGELIQGTDTTPLSNTDVIILGDTGYVSEDGGQTWSSETLDTNTLLGMGMILGLGGPLGASLDLYADPAIFTVTAGPDVELDGQMMHVQTLAVDLDKLLGTPEAAMALLEDGIEAGGDLMGISMDDLGMTPQQFAMVLPIMGQFMDGTAFSTTLYIGAEDGYIHYVEDNFALAIDLSATDPTQSPIKMDYHLIGTITRHNQPVAITAPGNVTEGEGGLLGDGGLFGGSGNEAGGLGDELFGSGN